MKMFRWNWWMTVLSVAMGATNSVIAQTPYLVPFQPDVQPGGRAVTVTINPTHPAHAIAASESGGLFMTFSGGSTWWHVLDCPMQQMSDVKFAPLSPPGQVVVIATAVGDGRTSTSGGIWRSLDGGFTWQRPENHDPFCPTLRSAYGIAFSPDGARVYVGTGCGIAIGLEYGARWLHVPQPSAPGAPVWAIAAHRSGSEDVVDLFTRGGAYKRLGVNSAGSSREIFAGRPPEPPGQPGGCSSVYAVAVPPTQPNVVFVAERSHLYEGVYDEGGRVQWGEVTPPPWDGRRSRGAWVGIGQWDHGNPGIYDVYASDGYRVFRQTCNPFGLTGSGCTSTGWQPVNVPPLLLEGFSQKDNNAITFWPETGLPAYIASDGGVYTPVRAVPSRFGLNWQSRNSARHGFAALQIYQVTGQIIAARRSPSGVCLPGRTDLYFGTQDNAYQASGDSGTHWPYQAGNEGGGIEVPRYASASNLPRSSGANLVIRNDAYYGIIASEAYWQNEQSWVPAGMIGAPTLISPNVYVQVGTSADPLRDGALNLNITPDQGRTWRRIATNLPSLYGPLQVSVNADNVTIYGADVRGSGSVGLWKVSGIHRNGSVDLPPPPSAALLSVSPADEGLGFKAVFAVDPNDPAHLLASDVGAHYVRVSRDGGLHWGSDLRLTDLVTGPDPVTHVRRYYFDYIDPNGFLISQITAIAFDPYYRDRILVGTESAGIFRSTDGGGSWTAIAGSTEATKITSFFFIENHCGDPNDTVIVSTYARGLWKLIIPPDAPGASLASIRAANASPANLAFGLPIAVATELAARVVDAYTGLPTPALLVNPNDNPHLRWLAIAGGKLHDIVLQEGFQVVRISIDSGRVVASSADGRPIVPALEVEQASQTGAFAGCPACQDLLKSGSSILGLVLEDGTLRAVLGGAAPLPGESTISAFNPPPSNPPPASGEIPSSEPKVWVVNPDSTRFLHAAFGNSLALYGTGFCGATGCSPVTVQIGGITVSNVIAVDTNGAIQATVLVPELHELGGPGQRNLRTELRATQRDPANQALEATTILIVSIGEDLGEGADPAPPNLLSAGTLDGTKIGLCFDSTVTQESATNAANYLVENGSKPVVSATLRPDGRSVQLTLAGPLPPNVNSNLFTVSATNILNLASNVGGGTVVGVLPTFVLRAADLGQPMPTGAVFSCESGSFEIIAGGADIWGTSDQCTFVSRTLTGDFDVRTQVIPVSGPNGAIGGIAARESATNASARSVGLFLMPNPNAPPNYLEATALIRSIPGTNSAMFGTANPADLSPMPLFRLHRLGNVFTAFVSEDGVAWKVVGRTDTSPTPFAGTLFVGFGAASPRSNQTTTVEFREFQFVQPAAPCLVLLCPTNVTVPCQTPGGALVPFDLFSTNHCDPGDLVVACNHPSGSLFPIGTTTVHCLASGSVETNQCTFTVTVSDLCSPPLTLAPFGSIWRYWDTGTDIGTAWRQPGFDDSAWSNGVARLGFGGDGEQTLLQAGHITYYFRHEFTITNVAALSNLQVRLKRDDGAVVYLNGTEVFRSNMPTGAPNALTFASLATSGADETNAFLSSVITAAILAPPPIQAPNAITIVVGVEVHQASANDGDLGFDLELVGNVAVPTSHTIQLPAGWTAIANSGNRGGNTLNEIIPSPIDGTEIRRWTPGTQSFSNSVYDAISASWSVNFTLAPGEGAWMNSPVPNTLTFLTPQPQPPGLVARPPAPGKRFVGCRWPVASIFEEVMGFPPAEGDKLQFFDGAFQSIPTVPSREFVFSNGLWTPAGPISSNPGGPVSWHPTPPISIPPGQGVFVDLVASAPAIISIPPATIQVAEGNPLALSIVATGVRPLFFQWRFNGVPIAGATNSLLTLATTTTNDAGAYSVLVTNVAGSVTSSNTIVSVFRSCPAILCSTNVVKSCIGPGGVVVNYSVSGGNPCNPGDFVLSCVPPSGSVFPVGVTTVNCTNRAPLAGRETRCSFTVTMVACCVSPPSGLVLWLPFDETSGNVAYNRASPLNNGVLFEGPGPATEGTGPAHQLGSYVNHSLLFDGRNDACCFDSVQVPDYPAINVGTGDFSLAAWIAMEPENNFYRLIVGKYGSTGFIFGTHARTLFLRVFHEGTLTDHRDTQLIPADGSWHFVAMTVRRDQPNGVQFYVDGLPTGTSDPSPHRGDLSNDRPLTVGGNESRNWQWAGSIDEVDMFRRALAPAEILSLYNAGSAGQCPSCVPATANLVAWWRAQGDALDAADSHHGTLESGASFAAGKVGQGFSFDGSGGFVSVPDSPVWDLGPTFTIEFWTKLHEIKRSMFIHQQSGAGAGGFEFDLQPGVGLVFGRNQSDALVRPWTPSPVVDTWYHLAVTRQADGYRLYVNGIQMGAVDPSADPVTDRSGPLRIGSYAGESGYGVNGLMDELSIHQRALSASELLAIYNAGSAGKCLPTDCSSNLLVNGSFETPGIPDGYVALPGGDSTIPGWVTTANGVEWYYPLLAPSFVNTGVAADGHYLLNLARLGGGGIRQTFNTVPGRRYTLSYSIGTSHERGRSGFATLSPRLYFPLGMLTEIVVLRDSWVSTASSTITWQLTQVEFTAPGSSATLEFYAGADPSTSFVNLDDVRVTDCPDALGSFGGLSYTVLGGATAQVVSNELILSNVGTQGTAGVSLTGLEGFQSGTITLGATDANALPEGASIAMSAFGFVNGNTNTLISSLRATRVGGLVEYIADYSSIGAVGCTVLLYDGSNLVAQAHDVTGVVARVTGPTFGDRWTPAFTDLGPARPFSVVEFPSRPFVALSGGQPVFGTRLVLLPQAHRVTDPFDPFVTPTYTVGWPKWVQWYQPGPYVVPAGPDVTPPNEVIIGSQTRFEVVAQGAGPLRIVDAQAGMFGFRHKAVGGAQLSGAATSFRIDPPPSLSNQVFGVDVFAGGSDIWDSRAGSVEFEAHWLRATPQPEPPGTFHLIGASLKATLHGSVAGGGTQPIASVEALKTGSNTITIQGSFPALGGSGPTMEIWHGSTLTFTGWPPPSVTVGDWPGDFDGVIPPPCFGPGCPDPSIGFRWSDPIVFAVAGGTNVLGDRIRFVASDPNPMPSLRLDFLGLRFGGGFPGLQLIAEHAAPSGVSFSGLAHRPIGTTSLTAGSNELAVTKLGTNADFGVSLALGNAPFADVSLRGLDSASPDFSQVRVESHGSLNGLPEQLLGAVIARKLGTNLEFTTDFSAAVPLSGPPQVTVFVYDGTNLVSVGPGTTSIVVRVQSILQDIWELRPLHQFRPGAYRTRFGFGDRRLFALSGGQAPVFGTRVEIQACWLCGNPSPQPSLRSAPTLSRVDVVARGLPTVYVSREKLALLAQAAESYRLSHLLGVGREIRVHNLIGGPGAPDGIVFPLGEDHLTKSFSVHWRPFDPWNLASTGAMLRASVEASLAIPNDPGHFVWAAVTHLGATKEISADFSAFNTASRIVTVLSSNMVVYSNTVAGSTGTVANVSKWIGDWSGITAFPGGNPGMWLRFWPPTEFQIGNVFVTGDEIRIVSEIPGATLGHLSSFSLQASGIPELQLTSAVAEHPGAITAKVQRFGDILAISWDPPNLRQALQSADSVTGPWADEPGITVSPHLTLATGARKFYRVFQR